MKSKIASASAQQFPLQTRFSVHHRSDNFGAHEAAPPDENV
jgi:hypothetical protein